MSKQSELVELISTKMASIGIVGLGYVGLPLALRCVEAGFNVVGLDVDEEKIAHIRNGKSCFSHIFDTRIANALELGLTVTSDEATIASVDAILLCVPTPLGKHQEPDLSYVEDALESLLPFLRSGQVICLESTTYPGTTEEKLVPRVKSVGLKVGMDVFVVYSPEREDPGNQAFNTQNIPKVVGGITDECLKMGCALYSQIVDEVVPVSSTRAAEMTKLLENIHRAVNIGLVNELKMVADKMDIDIYEVIRAASSKPFGFVPYYPGPGLGGHCIPIDPFYLTWKAKEYGLHTRFIELAGEINASMPAWVSSKVEHALNLRGKAVKGSKILILGVAYKKNTNDIRESPGVEIFSMLMEKGAEVSFHDPFVETITRGEAEENIERGVDLKSETISEQDCVVLCTDHFGVDYDTVDAAAELIIDTRGIFHADGSRVILA